MPIVLALSTGCQPEIGDSCSTSLDCSATNARICDTASAGGYCTIQGCDPDGCPNSALCVEWRGDLARTAETWCMAACSNDSDCRSAYTCLHEGDPELMDGDADIATVTDLDENLQSKGFCVYLEED